MTLSLIAAASINNVIGKDNRLLWNLPNDMKFFKNTTWGMPVIMGRKTYESLDRQSLPGRWNIVITRQRDWDPGNGNIQIADSLEKAISLARQSDCREIFIAGGGEVFAQAISIADRIYLTRVFVTIGGDTYFPEINKNQWALASRREFPPDNRHAYAYSFEVWERKK